MVYYTCERKRTAAGVASDDDEGYRDTWQRDTQNACNWINLLARDGRRVVIASKGDGRQHATIVVQKDGPDGCYVEQDIFRGHHLEKSDLFKHLRGMIADERLLPDSILTDLLIASGDITEGEREVIGRHSRAEIVLAVAEKRKYDHACYPDTVRLSELLE